MVIVILRVLSLILSAITIGSGLAAAFLVRTDVPDQVVGRWTAVFAVSFVLMLAVDVRLRRAGGR